MKAVANINWAKSRAGRAKNSAGLAGTGMLAALLMSLPGCVEQGGGLLDMTLPEAQQPAPPQSEPQRQPEPEPSPQPEPNPQPVPQPNPQPNPAPQPQPTPLPMPPGGGKVGGGPLRVVAVGDSVTEGTGDADGRGYPGTLLDQLQVVRPGSSVLNLGRFGWTSGELVNGTDTDPGQLDRAIAADPDVACVWIGSNDMWQLYENGPESGTSAADEAANLAEYTANIDAIVSRLTGSGARVFIGLMDDQALRPVSQDRATLPNTTAAEFVQMSAQVGRFNEAIRTVAQRYGATVVDFYNTTIFTSEATLDFDGIHANSAGYDQIAGMWFAAIEAVMD